MIIEPGKFYWMGQDVDEMSREKLVEIVIQQAHEIEMLRDSHIRAIDMWIAEVKARRSR